MASKYTATDILDGLIESCMDLVVEVNGPAIKGNTERYHALTMRTLQVALPVFLDNFEKHNGTAKADKLKTQIVAQYAH